ncbi:MAG: hypothetical protein WAX44_04165 [Minisyncoccia bacterium]
MSLPMVEGRELQWSSLTDFERACLVQIGEEVVSPNPNTHLIKILCDAVRLARQCADNPPLISIEDDQTRLRKIALKQITSVVNKYRRKDGSGRLLPEYDWGGQRNFLIRDILETALNVAFCIEGASTGFHSRDSNRVYHDSPVNNAPRG